MIRNVLAAALLAAGVVTTAGGAANAACEPLTRPVCPGAVEELLDRLPNPDDLYCWRDPSRIPGIYCRW